MCPTGSDNISGDRALETLMAGNKPYVASRQKHPHQTPERRNQVKNGQHPFAVILGCSDSRVPPEVIFDQGLGDLFVVRVAGNVVDKLVLGSIEYAVSHLTTPLVMILGHSECGAVTATLSDRGPAQGQIDCVAKAIQPAVDPVMDKPGNKVNNTAKANAQRMAKELRQLTPILLNSVRAGRLKVTAGYYHLSTGEVEILCP